MHLIREHARAFIKAGVVGFRVLRFKVSGLGFFGGFRV